MFPFHPFDFRKEIRVVRRKDGKIKRVFFSRLLNVLKDYILTKFLGFVHYCIDKNIFSE